MPDSRRDDVRDHLRDLKGRLARGEIDEATYYRVKEELVSDLSPRERQSLGTAPDGAMGPSAVHTSVPGLADLARHQEQPVPVPAVVAILAQTLAALAEAHDQGVMHRRRDARERPPRGRGSGCWRDRASSVVPLATQVGPPPIPAAPVCPLDGVNFWLLLFWAGSYLPCFRTWLAAVANGPSAPVGWWWRRDLATRESGCRPPGDELPCRARERENGPGKEVPTHGV